MSALHYLGVIFVIVTVIFLGVLSSKKVDKQKFSGVRSSKSTVVMGALIGTLVGGSSTIGTAQLAYSYGFSAWWFTLGGGIGVFLLGLVYKSKFYEEGLNTIPELIGREYGKKNADLVTILNSVGTFLSIVAQMISASALITAVMGFDVIIAIIISVFFIMCYVLFGGALSLGYAGTYKTVLIGLSILICGLFSCVDVGGIKGFTDVLETSRYFNLFARGISVDAGAGLSLIVGVITTQSYVSAIMMASDKKELNKGILSASIIVPLIGVAGIAVGMYMRINFPDINSKMALPLFILYKMPPLVGGIMIGTLLLTVVGTAAGLSFGMAKMYFKNFFEGKAKNEIWSIRIMITIILISAGALSYGDFGQYILNWSFLSMGLRGAVAFVPVIAALFFPKKIPSRYITIAIIVGPAITFVGKFLLPSEIDSLFPGVLAATLVTIIGYIKSNHSVRRRNDNDV